ncbi:MAG TPA: anaerobic sulfatase maturase [Bacteroidales bacterium]|nr:anaerobic sulfatase maturase [Bacteroidales bacterium]
MPDDFQIFVKPVGAVCNLGCTYCYYLSKKDLYESSGSLRMSDDILEKYIKQHIEASSDDTIFFSWHGGEPLLAGIDFYRKVVSMQKKNLPSGRKVLNGIQTNGTLLDEEWCHFLKSENFIIGISIDGPPDLHNKHRITPAGDHTSERVLRGYELLKKFKITSEILCVVNSSNSLHPLEVYNFFRQLGTEYLSFLPLVERDPSGEAGVSESTVRPEDFGRFLSVIFDEWTGHDIGKIKVQIFEEALRPAFNQEHTLCIFKVDCGRVPVLEHNGDFFSCDHFVDHVHMIGNILHKPVSEMLYDPQQKRFGKAKSQTLPRYCLQCDVLSMCNGECPKNRFITTPDGQPGLNYLCSGYKLFFNNCKPFISVLREIGLQQKTSGSL